MQHSPQQPAECGTHPCRVAAEGPPGSLAAEEQPQNVQQGAAVGAEQQAVQATTTPATAATAAATATVDERVAAAAACCPTGQKTAAEGCGPVEVASPVCYAAQFTAYTGVAPH